MKSWLKGVVSVGAAVSLIGLLWHEGQSVQAAPPSSNPQSFHQTVQMTLPQAGTLSSNSFIVPSVGTQLVIEEVSVAATDTQATLIGRLQTTVGGIVADHFLPAFPGISTAVGRPLTTVQSRRIYADPGSAVTISFEIPAGLATAPVTTQFWVTISGTIE